MSLIVWDGKVLAADTGLWAYDMRQVASKLAVSADGTVAVATVGAYTVGHTFRRLILEHGKIPKDVTLDRKDFTAIVVHAPAQEPTRVHYYDENTVTPVEVPSNELWYAGNAVAAGAAVALIEVSGMPAHLAVHSLLQTKRYDGIWGYTQYWTDGELHEVR